MNLIKRCPACGEENPIFEVICRVCMTNLSSVSPTPAGANEAAVPDTPTPRKNPEAAPAPEEMTVRAAVPRCRVLTLLRSDGRPVPVADGSELGRSGHYAELFNDMKTVSRRHAKITCEDDEWRIEDLGSTNGTWVNGQRLEQGRPYALKTGDTVKLSLSCELRVDA